jgi:flagellin-like hook-associated protein FlgL
MPLHFGFHRLRSLSTAALLLAQLALCGAAAGSQSKPSRTWVFDTDTGGSFSYILVADDGRSSSGSGDMEDYREIQRLRGRYGDEFLYLRRGTSRYVISDPALIAQVHDLMAPQELLGRRQALLGEEQSALGARQARLGGRQAELGAQQAALGAEQRRLAAELSRRAARGLDTDDLERRVNAISDEQNALGARQNELGEQQNRLGEQQSGLGERQAALGREQARLGEQIAGELSKLLDQALASGRVERLGPRS